MPGGGRRRHQALCELPWRPGNAGATRLCATEPCTCASPAVFRRWVVVAWLCRGCSVTLCRLRVLLVARSPWLSCMDTSGRCCAVPQCGMRECAGLSSASGVGGPAIAGCGDRFLASRPTSSTAQSWPMFGQCWPNLGQVRSKFGRTWPTSVNIRPILAEVRPTLAQFGPF